MVNLTKYSQVFNLKKTPNNYYQIDLAKKTANTQNLALKNLLRNAQDFSPWEIVPALPGLVPLGSTPFYTVPNEPTAPDNCDLYPDSPFCGGIPLTFTPIGIEPAIVLDDCNIGIQLTPVFGFIELPPVQIVYRSNAASCQPAPIATATANPAQGFCLDFLCSHSQHRGIVTCHITGTAVPVGDFNEFNHPGYVQNEERETPLTPAERQAAYEPYSSSNFPYFGPSDFKLFPEGIGDYINKGGTYFKYFQLDIELTGEYDYAVICVLPSSTGEEPYRPDFSVQPTYYNRWIIEFYNSPTQPDKIHPFTGQILPFAWLDDFTISFSCSLPPFAPPPPPPMECCPPPFDPALLTLILANQEKIMNAIGVEDYPVTLPVSLITTHQPSVFNPFDNNSIGDAQAPDSTSVLTLTQLMAQFIKYFDEVVGQWEVPIQIKDTDPTTPGDQPVGIKLPNMAEAIAEMMGLMLQTSYNSEALINIAVRNLIETGSDKVQNYRSYMLLQSLIDYVGYKYDEKESSLPMLFTPGKEKLDELLVEYQQPVVTAEFNEKLGLPDDLRKFLEAWSMIKATHFRKVNTTGSATETAANVLKIIKDLQSNLNKVTEEPEDAPTPSSDNFYESVEQGFINEPGATNTTDPYGNPYADRPKIREIGN